MEFPTVKIMPRQSFDLWLPTSYSNSLDAGVGLWCTASWDVVSFSHECMLAPAKGAFVSLLNKAGIWYSSTCAASSALL
eukprot:SAG31_NODE_491_length_14923_cov_12.905221_3_plen_79_part_00